MGLIVSKPVSRRNVTDTPHCQIAAVTKARGEVHVSVRAPNRCNVTQAGLPREERDGSSKTAWQDRQDPSQRRLRLGCRARVLPGTNMQFTFMPTTVGRRLAEGLLKQSDLPRQICVLKGLLRLYCDNPPKRNQETESKIKLVINKII